MIELEIQRSHLGEVAGTTPEDRAFSLEPRERSVSSERLEPRDRFPSFGHFQRLACLYSTEIHAQVLAQLTNPDTLHDAQKVEHPRPRRRIAYRGSQPLR
jgi:hypothetical protein